MMYIYELSKENLKLAKAEVLALINPTQHQIKKNLLFTNKLYKPERLAYTKTVYKYLGTNINKIQWNRYYKTSFKVTAKGKDERTIAENIWDKLKNPKVNLKNPKTHFHLLNKKYYAKLIHKNENNYETRKSHNRPEPHPSSLHPKLARAMVNLTGTKTSLLDPFCGSGGILLEAVLMKLKTTGYDIDKIQLKRAKINLKHFKTKATLKQKDATTIKTASYIATDLPYGRNTKTQTNKSACRSSTSRTSNINHLLKQFLKIKAKRIVIGLPDFIKLPKTKYKTINKFTIYLHKSLSKHIYVLE